MIEIFFEYWEQIINNELVRLFFFYVGIIYILSTLLLLFVRFLIFMFYYFKSSGFKWLGGPHTWAIVTGCTEGIGLAFAKELYRKGYNLLLISRNLEKLEKVKEEIQTKYGHSKNIRRKIRVLAIDFNNSSDETYDNIETEFENLDEIHVLVNNVGVNYPGERPEYFTQIPNLKEVIMSLINVNIVAGTRLTALVLPRMERRGRGAIINLSSFSALSPTPLLTLYSATKVYMDYMSRALQEEYRSKGVIIQSLTPYYVSTRMTYNMKPRFYAPTPNRYVRSAIKTVGHSDRTSGYFVHQVWNLSYWLFGVVSRLMGIDLNIKVTYYRLKGIRNRIMQKEAQEAKEAKERPLIKDSERIIEEIV